MLCKMSLIAAFIVSIFLGSAGPSSGTVIAATDFGTIDGTNIVPFSTDYQPMPDTGATTPGHYYVAKSGAGYSWSSFDWGGLDHTNPGTGCFMVVDGSTDSSQAIVKYTVNGVAGQLYNLTGWVMQVQHKAGANVILSFRVNGVEQATFPRLPDSPWVWHYFSFTYKSTISGPITFALHDNEPSWDFNDFGLDDLNLQIQNANASVTMLLLLE